nr:MAG TPA: hypothetical protein [Caudoviricetes sp.]
MEFQVLRQSGYFYHTIMVSELHIILDIVFMRTIAIYPI